MNAVVKLLESTAQGPFGCIVHFGAVHPDVIDAYETLNVQRLVVVAADSEMAAQCSERCRGRTTIEIVEAAVAPSAGTGEWLRFNVSELNGMLEPTGARKIFPRLRGIGRVPVRTVDLPSILASLGLSKRPDAPNALVLDMPGLEASILRQVDASVLGAFDWIALRGAVAGLFDRADAPAEAPAWLASRHFHAKSEDGSDPLWAVTVARFDPRSAALAAAEQRSRALEAQVEAANEARTRAERQAQDLQAQLDPRSAALAAAEQRSRALEARVEAANEARTRAERQAQDLQDQLDARSKSHDEQAGLAASRLGKIGELEAAMADAARRLQAAGDARAKAEKALEERQEQVDAISRSRDEQAKLAKERLERVARLETELADLTARFELLKEELIKAEAHVELISDLLLREPLR